MTKLSKSKLSKLEAELMKFRRSKPYVPFTMKFKNGDAFDVAQPLQFAFVTRHNRGIFLHPKRGIVRFRLDEIDQLEVTKSRKR
jgi:hypothetical protein